MRSSHRVICFVAAASLAAALAGCAENLASHASPETPTTGADRATVTGRVLDTSGTPIPGATVALRSFGEHATADATGHFSLDVPANTTLTIATTAPNMAPTLLQQLMVSPAAKADVEIPLITTDRFKTLVTMGANPAGGVLAVAVKSMSGAGVTGATVQLTPSNLGRVMYAPTGDGMADPDPTVHAVIQGEGDESYAWVLGVQPHVTIMQVALQGVSQIAPPYAIDDVTWPGTFTVDPNALTIVTLFTP
jgi:hypothetical protein